jgi:PKD repeat protein
MLRNTQLQDDLNIRHLFNVTGFVRLCAILVTLTGVFSTPSVHADTHYVSLSGDNTPPYTNWVTAATQIQFAVDTATAGDIVLVSNGTYNTGARITPGATLSNRVVITNAITLQSVNGPLVTEIRGQGPMGSNAIRCVYLASNAVMSGFTVTNGFTRAVLTQGLDYDGGGAYAVYAIVSNCIFTGNGAGFSGGGTFGGALYNCLIYGNVAGNRGGGASQNFSSGFILNNCTVVGNTSSNIGGGTQGGARFLNSIVYFNTATASSSNYAAGTFSNSCTAPLPSGGTNNITANPLFVNSGTGNFKLQSGSPGINTGTNQDWMSGAYDLANIQRIVSGIVDMGAYEFTSDQLAGNFTSNVQTGAAPLTVVFTASVTGSNLTGLVYHWDFENNSVIDLQGTNLAIVTNTYGLGTYSVALSVSNLIGELIAITKTNYVTALVDVTNKYVSLQGGHIAPFITWATAATNIQAAVDAAGGGDTIWVSNGVYETGSRVTPGGSLSNRIAVTNNVTIRSVNGPAYTVIKGGGSLSDSAVRCAYMSQGRLIGFTLTNGFTRVTGDATLDQTGGGAFMTAGSLSNCLLTGNTAAYGGGAEGGSLANCTLRGNTAFSGGGAENSTLKNCEITGNRVSDVGGGAYGSVLNNCTLTGNSADSSGGGTSASALKNCIMFFNSAPTGANYSTFASSFHYCFTTPMPPSGTANNTNNPMLLSSSRIALNSPCAGAGLAAYASGVDVDGSAWQNPPSVGCDEVVAGSLTGALQVAITPASIVVAVDAPIIITSYITGQVASNILDFGDGTSATNIFSVTHAWSTPGNYTMELRAYNLDNPGGVLVTTTVQVLLAADTARYVSTNSPSPAFPYTSWETAAHTLQEAVDAQTILGGWVIATDGVYNAGSRITPGALVSNRVVITNNIVLKSVNGPEYTVIKGGGNFGNAAVRCVYISNGRIEGFTLSNGFTRVTGDTILDQSGAGIFSSGGFIRNCNIISNSAGFYGGGAYGGQLNNCKLTGNSSVRGGGAYNSALNGCALYGNRASNLGGGAEESTLTNCTVTANSAGTGSGGVSACDALNSIVYFNSSPLDPNHSGGALNYCFTSPMPNNGVGNRTNDPGLLSSTRLALHSPCVQAGLYTLETGFDIDGEAWQIPPSIGCDEVVAGSLTGDLHVAITPQVTLAANNTAIGFIAVVEGRVASNLVTFGDGSSISNVLRFSHSWSSTGLFTVVLRAYNLSNPGGVTATTTIQIVSAENNARYVWTNSPVPTVPFDSWATAAHTIQEAVDAQTLFGGWIVVTDGVYDVGGRVVPGNIGGTNRIVVTNNTVIKSVNGPAVTVIMGKGPISSTSVRCAYLNPGRIEGMTLTNGHNNVSAGGVYAENGSLSNCILSGNFATFTAGGVFYGTLENCLLIGNGAKSGGGANVSTLRHCTIASNTATEFGGGASASYLDHCVLIGNTASNGGGIYLGTVQHSVLKGNIAYATGGGAFQTTLFDCLVSGNTAASAGGTFFGTLERCTVAGNSAGNNSGGILSGSLNNCIIQYNSAPLYSNYYGATMSYCSSTPLPTTGVGNISSDPLFENAPAGNWHLSSASPCIDTGEYRESLVGAQDLEGRPRIMISGLDIGAYEFAFEGSLKAILAGAHSGTGGVMRADLQSTLATNSPYAADPRTVADIPPDTVDWVLVQTRTNLDNAAVFSRSYFLRNDGFITDESGETNVLIEATGDQFLIVQHRNHLAIASPTAVLTNRLFNYDFTTDSGQYHGGTNAAVEIVPGVWAMRPGDADGDGEILPADEMILQTQGQ